MINITDLLTQSKDILFFNAGKNETLHVASLYVIHENANCCIYNL